MREAPQGGVFIAGRFIPGGSQVRIPSHVIQRDPKNFERPLEYLPERWLKTADDKLFNKGAFFPLLVPTALLIGRSLTTWLLCSLFGPFQCVIRCFTLVVADCSSARSCVGKQFAYQEMRLFIATILWKYDMKFSAGFDSYAWEAHVKDNGTLLEIHEPLDVVLACRKL